jgi:hypothetical protein
MVSLVHERVVCWMRWTAEASMGAVGVKVSVEAGAVVRVKVGVVAGVSASVVVHP